MSTDSTKNYADQEVDLSGISRGINSFFQSVGYAIFRCIRFILRNIIIVAILFVVGLGLGIYLDRTQRVYDNQIVVTPSFGSTDYLYSKINLLNAKIRENDTSFLKSIGIQKPTKLLGIKASPIIDIYKFATTSELNYKTLELLAEDSDIQKIIEENITSKNYSFHEISYATSEKTSDQKTVAPIMKFLNTSSYYSKLQKEHLKNVAIKMKANEVTIAQIDAILNEYGQPPAAGMDNSKSGNLIYNNDTQLNDIIKTKDELIEQQGRYRLDMVSLDNVIKESSSTINIQNKKAANGKMKLILPFLFISIFIMIFLFKSFYNKQSNKYNVTNS